VQLNYVIRKSKLSMDVAEYPKQENCSLMGNNLANYHIFITSSTLTLLKMSKKLEHQSYLNFFCTKNIPQNRKSKCRSTHKNVEQANRWWFYINFYLRNLRCRIGILNYLPVFSRSIDFAFILAAMNEQLTIYKRYSKWVWTGIICIHANRFLALSH